MLFDQHVFSLSCRGGWRMELRSEGGQLLMVSERLGLGPLCVRQSAHRTLVSAQEMATDTMTRPRDHSVTRRGVIGQRQEPGPRLRGPDSTAPVACGSEGGEQSGAGIPLLTPFLEWLSPGAPDSRSPVSLSAPRDQRSLRESPLHFPPPCCCCQPWGRAQGCPTRLPVHSQPGPSSPPPARELPCLCVPPGTVGLYVFEAASPRSTQAALLVCRAAAPGPVKIKSPACLGCLPTTGQPQQPGPDCQQAPGKCQRDLP